jgi:hypothetical protein
MLRFPLLSAPTTRQHLWFAKPKYGDEELTKEEQQYEEHLESIRHQAPIQDLAHSYDNQIEDDDDEIMSSAEVSASDVQRLDFNDEEIQEEEETSFDFHNVTEEFEW